MRRRSIVLVCLLAALMAGLAAAAPTGARQETAPTGRSHVAGELIVRFKPGLGQAARRRILGRHEASRKRSLRGRGLELVRLDAASLAEVAAELEREPGILGAQPNYVYRVSATPNDPRFGELWGLHTANDADMDLPEAWDVTTGSASVTVAVIDTGVMYTHLDLAGNIWSNSGETADGSDNDGNGHVDDVRGWDFVDNDALPTDPHGHGTHVAGTVGAQGDNGVGVTGVNWDVGVMPLRAGDADGSFTDDSIADAMNYACTEGADVVNGSFGGEGYSPVIASAISSCPGTLFVFAAGNGGVDGMGDNIDASPPVYPCAFTHANVVCVAASTQSAGIASFSNYGPVSVDVAAPGTAILSTVITAPVYDSYSGTSMASPHVAGVAALLLARDPAATPAQIKYSLMRTVDPLQAFAGKIATGGRVNAYGVLTAPLLDPPPEAPPPPPPPPPPDTVPPSSASPVSTSHPVGAPTTRNTIVMTWSGAFDQGSGVDGFSYHWDKLPTSTPDQVKDAEETSTGVTSAPFPGGSYYFHLSTRDNAGNWSEPAHAGPYVVLSTPATRCIVPKLAGKTLASTRTALRRARCALGRIRRVRTRRSRVGRVVAQGTRPGTRRPPGTRVAVTIGRR